LQKSPVNETTPNTEHNQQNNINHTPSLQYYVCVCADSDPIHTPHMSMRSYAVSHTHTTCVWWGYGIIYAFTHVHVHGVHTRTHQSTEHQQSHTINTILCMGVCRFRSHTHTTYAYEIICIVPYTHHICMVGIEWIVSVFTHVHIYGVHTRTHPHTQFLEHSARINLYAPTKNTKMQSISKKAKIYATL